MTMPMPKAPLLTPSGTPKLRSVTCAKLPPISFIVAHPFFQPLPWMMVSTVRCVVPERQAHSSSTWAWRLGTLSVFFLRFFLKMPANPGSLAWAAVIGTALTRARASLINLAALALDLPLSADSAAWMALVALRRSSSRYVIITSNRLLTTL